MSARTFKITKELCDNGALILKVDGDLDGHSANELQSEVTKELGLKRFKLIIDLTHVKYMSSAGAGVFILCEAETQKNGGDTLLLNPVKSVQHVFELLGILAGSNVFYDREEALNFFARE